MCSVSWRHRPGRGQGYLLLFNRDEQRARESATAPVRDTHDGVPFLSPRDGRAGGSWLLANAFGLSVGLLNHYAADRPGTAPGEPVSRGRLVLSMAACRSPDDFDARMGKLEPAGRYRPFLMFAIGPAAPLSLWRWDGGALRKIPSPPACFLTTSSYQTDDVLAWRRRQRDALGAHPDPDALRALHRGHDPANPARSVRMRRADAQTVSFSEIETTPETGVRYLYRAEPSEGLELLEEQRSQLPPSDY